MTYHSSCPCIIAQSHTLFIRCSYLVPVYLQALVYSRHLCLPADSSCFFPCAALLLLCSQGQRLSCKSMLSEISTCCFRPCFILVSSILPPHCQEELRQLGSEDADSSACAIPEGTHPGMIGAAKPYDKELCVVQGLLPNYIKVVPSIAIAFVTYEQVCSPPFFREPICVF